MAQSATGPRQDGDDKVTDSVTATSDILTIIAKAVERMGEGTSDPDGSKTVPGLIQPPTVALVDADTDGAEDAQDKDEDAGRRVPASDSDATTTPVVSTGDDEERRSSGDSDDEEYVAQMVGGTKALAKDGSAFEPATSGNSKTTSVSNTGNGTVTIVNNKGGDNARFGGNGNSGTTSTSFPGVFQGFSNVQFPGQYHTGGDDLDLYTGQSAGQQRTGIDRAADRRQQVTAELRRRERESSEERKARERAEEGSKKDPRQMSDEELREELFKRERDYANYAKALAKRMQEERAKSPDPRTYRPDPQDMRRLREFTNPAGQGLADLTTTPYSDPQNTGQILSNMQHLNNAMGDRLDAMAAMPVDQMGSEALFGDMVAPLVSSAAVQDELDNIFGPDLDSPEREAFTSALIGSDAKDPTEEEKFEVSEDGSRRERTDAEIIAIRDGKVRDRAARGMIERLRTGKEIVDGAENVRESIVRRGRTLASDARDGDSDAEDSVDSTIVAGSGEAEDKNVLAEMREQIKIANRNWAEAFAIKESRQAELERRIQKVIDDPKSSKEDVVRALAAAAVLARGTNGIKVSEDETIQLIQNKEEVRALLAKLKESIKDRKDLDDLSFGRLIASFNEDERGLQVLAMTLWGDTKSMDKWFDSISLENGDLLASAGVYDVSCNLPGLGDNQDTIGKLADNLASLSGRVQERLKTATDEYDACKDAVVSLGSRELSPDEQENLEKVSRLIGAMKNIANMEIASEHVANLSADFAAAQARMRMMLMYENAQKKLEAHLRDIGLANAEGVMCSVNGEDATGGQVGHSYEDALMRELAQRLDN
jgi:hypothetical protein